MHKTMTLQTRFAGLLMLLVILTAGGTSAQTYTVLYGFSGGADGDHPIGGLAQDAAGNLYGTTYRGGDFSCGDGYGCGTVFKLIPNPDGTWTESTIHAFASENDGAIPYSGVVLDSAGNLYGTTTFGGSYGAGTVFKLAPNPDGSYTESLIYQFTGGSDGLYPEAALLRDAAGNLYGTASAGGAGYGVVFSLAPLPGGGWKGRILHRFTGGRDGNTPRGGSLVFDSAGSLYGTTSAGGNFGLGVVFKGTPLPNGGWKKQILHHFNSGEGSPLGGLVLDATGSIYGTTKDGGAQGQGAVFMLQTDKTYRVLYEFEGGNDDGAFPNTAMVFDTEGNLYGTTYEGGSGIGGANTGVLYKLTPNDDGSWSESVLYDFTIWGCQPTGPLIIDGQNDLYGTTSYCSDGNAYELAP